ncbi:MAG: DNA polymerase domain-containing protein [Candidatus Methanosuratincola petrocarbonis]
MPGLDSFIPDSQSKRRQPPRLSGGPSGTGRGPAPPRSPRGERPPGGVADELEREEASEPEEVDPDTEAEAEAEGIPAHEAEEAEEIIAQTKFEAETPSETGSCVLLSVSYSGNRGRALAKLYDLERQRVVFWYDNTGHQPYLLTDMRLDELLSSEAASHPGFDPRGCREVEKHDLLQDKAVTMTKVAAKDPTSVGGRGTGIRDLLGERSWEDRIRYHECFVYDRRLVPGYYYRIRGGSLVPESQPVPTDALKKAFPDATPAFLDSLTEWFPIFSSPVPDYRRVAIDIEVATEAQDRVPDPQVAANPVICVSAVGSDGRKQVLILRREGFDEDGGSAERPKELPEDASLVYFDREIDLLREVFRLLLDYPIVLTFNGDNFDLHYLWKRAQVLGMRREEIPIVMGREIALLPVGVHIDLYKFFHNHAIQIYAFGNAYKELTLDAISEALLGIKKIQLEKSINELDYLSLANYCFRDSLITLRLTAEHSSLVMNLITLIMRISRVSMEDATRQGVSSWIRSLFYDEHRKGNYLIPKKEDISLAKGGSSTTAVIKGKKYKGALVIKPESGVFFNVIVLDFASLYPSIISRWNLSYETVRCPHPECRKNLVPDTDHWVCTKRVGMMAHVVGLLRDVRVRWFKPKSKDPSLSEEEKNYYKVVQQALKVFLNACFTGDTEILTVDGPKNIKEVEIGDKVINVNPTTLEPEIDEVIAKQEYDYSGDLIHFEYGQAIDLIVTPDHKFLVQNRTTGTRFVTAKEVFESNDLVLPRINALEINKTDPKPPTLADAFQEMNGLLKLACMKTHLPTSEWKKSLIPYKGRVYCLTTKKNHTVFAGRNGRFTYCGQCYGVFGAEIFPLYCLPLADSTTAIGRNIITETIEEAKALGMKVLYSDTDSIFLHQPTKEQISSLLSWAESKFGIDLEIDKRYTFVTFSGRKKNYLGVLDSGIVDIKGLMGKKRNTPPFIKNAFVEMTQVLREVKSPQDFEAAKSKIKAIVQRCYSDLKARRIPLDDLVFKVMISRPLDRYDKTTPQHVKAAKLLEEKGKEVKPGDLISFVKVQGPLGVKPVQLARIDEVDVDKYVGHIESTFGQVLEALNIDFEEIVGVKRLDFFSR